MPACEWGVECRLVTFLLTWGVIAIVLLVPYFYRKKPQENSINHYADCRLEKDYQKVWQKLNGGEIEITVGTHPVMGRIDWVGEHNNRDVVAEVDFDEKWSAAIGQSLFYSAMTGKRGLILLILRNPSDRRHVQKIIETIDHHKLSLDVVTLPGSTK